jgi:hypothetical protein
VSIQSVSLTVSRDMNFAAPIVSMKLVSLAFIELELRTGSSTPNEVGFTEQPTSNLQMNFINNQQTVSPIN